MENPGPWGMILAHRYRHHSSDQSHKGDTLLLMGLDVHAAKKHSSLMIKDSRGRDVISRTSVADHPASSSPAAMT
jgi:hypothetical protein